MLSVLFAPVMAMSISTTTVPQEMVEVRKVDVAISDLNLADPQDRARLERRLNSAAYKVCGRTFTGLTTARKIEQRNCLAAAHASYQEQVRVALNEATGSTQRVSLRQN